MLIQHMVHVITAIIIRNFHLHPIHLNLIKLLVEVI